MGANREFYAGSCMGELQSLEREDEDAKDRKKKGDKNDKKKKGEKDKKEKKPYTP